MNLMKNYIAAIISIIFLICPSICFSSYLIELNNGSTFITYHYWKEGSQIKFYCYGGVVGIQKDLVREIKESDLAYREVIDEPYVPEAPEVQAEAKGKSEEKKEKMTSVSDARDKALQEEKRRIMTEIQAARAAFVEAKAKNDRERMQAERKKLLSLQTELLKLREKVRDDHGGQAPAWWDEPLPAP